MGRWVGAPPSIWENAKTHGLGGVRECLGLRVEEKVEKKKSDPRINFEKLLFKSTGCVKYRLLPKNARRP